MHLSHSQLGLIFATHQGQLKTFGGTVDGHELGYHEWVEAWTLLHTLLGLRPYLVPGILQPKASEVLRLRTPIHCRAHSRTRHSQVRHLFYF